MSAALRVVVALCACAASLTACTKSALGPSAADLAPMTTALSNGETYFVAWRPEPDPIPVNTPFAVDLWVLVPGAAREPVEGVTVQLQAWAREHEQAMDTTPRITALGPGHFRGEGLLFHLPGRWELYADITADGVTERAQFDLRVR